MMIQYPNYGRLQFGMKCPNCGFEQPEGLAECGKCQIFFAKFAAKKAREAEPPAAPPPQPAPPPKPPMSRLKLVLIALAAVMALPYLLGAVFYMFASPKAGRAAGSSSPEAVARVSTVNVPIDYGATMMSAQQALVAKGYGKVMVSDLRVVYFHGPGGRMKAYSSTAALPPKTSFIPMTLHQFLLRAQETEAAGIVIDSGGPSELSLDKSDFAGVLAKLQESALPFEIRHVFDSGKDERVGGERRADD